MEVLTRHAAPTRRRFLACIALALLDRPATAQDRAPAPSEYAVKAALLYKFLRYLTWPEEGLPEEGEAIRIGVLGKDPFGTILDETVAGKTLLGHPLEVARGKSIKELGACSVVFIAASEKNRIAELLDELAKRPVLAVGDSEGFAEQGVMINLVLRDNKVKFQINYGAAREAGIEIDAQLLRLAELVGETTEGEGEGETPAQG